MQIFQQDTCGPKQSSWFKMQIRIMNNKNYCTINQIWNQLNICFSLQWTPNDHQQHNLSVFLYKSCTHTWMPLPQLLSCWERFVFLKISAWWIFIHAPGQILLSAGEALNHCLLQVTDYSVRLIQMELIVFFFFFCSLHWITCGISVIKDLPQWGR